MMALSDSAPRARSTLALVTALQAYPRIPGLSETEQRVSDYHCLVSDKIAKAATAPRRDKDKEAQCAVEARRNIMEMGEAK